MYVADLEGQVRIDRQHDLVARLQSVRKAQYGAFILWHGETGSWHDDTGPDLWIHINGTIAYLYFFPDKLGTHAGFQPTGMCPAGCNEGVRFVLTDGIESAGLMMPPDTLVPVEVAYTAAIEFFKEPVLPVSIRWSEL
jgi:hypothetical protein